MSLQAPVRVRHTGLAKPQTRPPFRINPYTAAGVALLLALALGLRLFMLVRSGWLLEGDDSLSSLMAVGILDHGDHPIMLKNQPYAAAWQPYLMAGSFALFGVSRMAAKLPELGTSLILVGVTALLAREVGGTVAGWLAATLASVPPVYDLVLNLKPWAPYTEVAVFGTLCLWSATRLAFPSGRVARVKLCSALCGTAGGLAFWMHPLAVEFLLAAALIVLVRLRGRALLLPTAIGLASFALGSFPFWLYNALSGWSTLAFILAGTSHQTPDRWAVFTAWWNADLPRALGLWSPWGPTLPPISTTLAAIQAAAIVCAAALGRGSRHWLRPLDTALVLLVLIPSVLVLSGFGGPALNDFGFDATGRYAPPLWTALAIILATCLARLWSAGRGWVIGLTAAIVLVNASGTALANPVLAFQSPYWSKLPVDSSQLLSVLQSDGITTVWMNHWAGLPLMFDARVIHQPLVAYDWYDVAAGGIDRFPEYKSLVTNSDKPAFVLVTKETDPALTFRLRDLGVDFTEQRSGPYVIVTPLSRRVDPSEVADALDYRY